MNKAQVISDELNRSVKLAVDSGEVGSLEEAQRLFEGYRLRVFVGDDVVNSATLQVALLTTVNAARRCFLGGVEIIGCLKAKLLVPWKNFNDLYEAVTHLGGVHVVVSTDERTPSISIGNVNAEIISSDFAVRATFDGWIAGVTPLADKFRLAEEVEFTPSGVLAGALATSEAFQYVRGTNALAGRRNVAVSLWEPDRLIDWLEVGNIGPALEFLPSRVWMIGLGHLGQAFLWTLGVLPYRDPADLLLVLQDTDNLVKANVSTSPLTDLTLISKKKTRAMAEWCEERGFRARVIERLFSDDIKINHDEPRLAICGVDNVAARRSLESAGFDHIVEAGLGKGGEEYLGYQIHTFPGARLARDTWPTSFEDDPPFDPSAAPAYRMLEAEGFDECGLTQLGNRSVGACFVGLFTSTLVIAEILRTLIGGSRYDVLGGSLRNPNEVATATKDTVREVANLGYTVVA